MTDLERELIDVEARFPMGRKVRFYPFSNSSKHIEAEIRSKPWALGGGDILIAITGKAGGVDYFHLEAI